MAIFYEIKLKEGGIKKISRKGVVGEKKSFKPPPSFACPKSPLPSCFANIYHHLDHYKTTKD
jgi:hypothetical protein